MQCSREKLLRSQKKLKGSIGIIVIVITMRVLALHLHFNPGPVVRLKTGHAVDYGRMATNNIPVHSAARLVRLTDMIFSAQRKKPCGCQLARSSHQYYFPDDNTATPQRAFDETGIV